MYLSLTDIFTSYLKLTTLSSHNSYILTMCKNTYRVQGLKEYNLSIFYFINFELTALYLVLRILSGRKFEEIT